MNDSAENWRLALGSGMARTPFIAALEGETFVDGPGRVRMRLPYSPRIVGNPDTGIPHGGVTGFLDHCCGMSVGSATQGPRSFVTLDLRIDYMKPAKPGAEIWFAGECTKIAHDVAFARARAYQDSPDDPIAIATGAFMFTNTSMPSGS